jgi:7-cyano-7-deazaguanine synthase in queuosine biosynthesis
MTEARVFMGTSAPLTVRLHGRHPTFRIDAEKIEAKLVAPVTPVLEDLLEIACTVFAADGSRLRGGGTRPGLGATWRRTFTFEIPVRDPDFWSGAAVTRALADAVRFLTDDDVSFQFFQGKGRPSLQSCFPFEADAAAFRADEVVLFSGGLDSFAGALEALASRKQKVALVSHVSAQKVERRQRDLAKYLAGRFPGRVLHVPIKANRIGPEAVESTQRSRSLLFVALGQVVAHMMGAKIVRLYENGVVSHQLPISPQVVGTMATRTTHPLSLRLLNDLMAGLPLAPIPIENPFQWHTKADVLRQIMLNGGEAQIAEAVSCAGVRDQSIEKPHCGACSQCLDRRFGVLAEGLGNFDPAERYATDVLLGARATQLSATLAGFWTTHAMETAQIDDRAFLERYGQEFSRICRGYPEIPAAEVMKRCLDMHRRQGRYVIRVLAESAAEHADDLVYHKLPATSLLRIHIAGISPVVLIPRDGRSALGPGLTDSSDQVLDGRLPEDEGRLTVVFDKEASTWIVVIRSLGRVEGNPARVAHLLKPAFDEDRARRLPAFEHRFVEAGKLAQTSSQHKEWVRQNVKRCRDKLAEFHYGLHGAKPPSPLLIEGRQTHGYRLDPGIILDDT